MRTAFLLAAIVVLLLPRAGAETAFYPLKPVKNGVTVQGSVVSVGGIPQRNVYGRCMTLQRYEAHYSPKVPIDYNSAIIFGSEWRSGDDGTFKLSLLPGEYMLWAHGAKHKAVKLTVPKGARSVNVKVMGRTDNVLATFEYVTPEGAAFPSGGPKDYRVDYWDTKPPFYRFFWVKDVGYATALIREEDLLREEPILVRFRKGTYVSGTVVSESTGRPLGGVVIFPMRDRRTDGEFAGWNEMFGYDPHSELTSGDKAAAISRDGDGSFTLGPLPPGDYSVLFTLPRAGEGFREKLESPLHVTEGKTPEPLNVKVSNGKTKHELRGRALNGNTNTPIADTMITINVQSSGPTDYGSWVEHWYIWEPVAHQVKTDSNGGFTLYPLDSGMLWFTVSWNGLQVYDKKVTLPCIGKTVDFVLLPPKPEPKPALPAQRGRK